MKRNIRKAVFPVAGLGSRFLPVTKAMPKELLPIVDKPLIQYAVEEAVSAGLDTLIFVTGRNKRAIEDHFDNNQELELILRTQGKTVEADMVKNILPVGVECTFVRQPEPLGLGHAVLCAERVIAEEPFAVLLADDFLPSKESNVTSDLIKAHDAAGMSQLAVMEINGPEISNYGVVVPDKNESSMIGLIEKPDFKDAPSNLASIGRYVLKPEIFKILKNQDRGRNGEIQLADALNHMAINGSVQSLKVNCQRFDCGSVKGYLKAIVNSANMQDLI